MESSKSLIFAERPYIIVLTTNLIDVEERKYCWSCCKKIKCFRCAKCKIAAYCSKECQLRDWMTKQHKYECEVFARAPNEIRGWLFKDLRASAELRFVGRIVARKRTDGGIQPEEDRIRFPENAVVRSLLDVPTAPNVDNFVAFPPERFDFHGFLSIFRDCYAALSDFYAKTDDSEIRYAYTLLRSVATIELFNGTTNVEQSEITNVEQPQRLYDVLGVALFLQMTRFRYSCDPDVIRIQENGISYFKLIKPDKEGLDLDLLTTNFDLYGRAELIRTVTESCKKRYYHRAYSEGKDSRHTLLEAECSYCNSKMSESEFFLREECSTCSQSLMFQLESNSVKCPRCDITIPSSRKKIEALKEAVHTLQTTKMSFTSDDSDEARYQFVTESAKLLNPVKNFSLFGYILDMGNLIAQLDLCSVVFPGSYIPGYDGEVCECHYDSKLKKYTYCLISHNHLRIREAEHNLARNHIALELSLLCNSLDPEKLEIKKFGKRFRYRGNAEWIIPLLEVCLRGMDYYGFQLEAFIQLRQDISEIYARVGLKVEAYEIASRARETLAMCYFDSHPRVKELDAHLQKITKIE